MINYKKGLKIDNIITQERETIKSYNTSQTKIKKEIEAYIKDLDKIKINDESFKIILLNDFNNSIGQIDNNIQDIQSLNDILDILESQEELQSTDIYIYNKLLSKIDNNALLVKNIIEKALSRFDNVNITDDEASVKSLKKMHDSLLKVIYPEKASEAEKEVAAQAEKSATKTSKRKSIKKVADLTSSDLLCFFPKNESDNLVISTIQNCYKLSFVKDVASISIEHENFNLSLKTAGVQVSNSSSNNVLLVSYIDSKYVVLTNNQMEIPTFIQICKISKKDDFIEVEIYADKLSICVEDNIINFTEDVSQPTEKAVEIEQEVKVPAKKAVEEKKVEEVKETKKETPKPSVQKKAEEVKPEPAPEPEEVTDNDTLIISDSNKNVILPYKVSELEAKLKKSKKYKTLQDVIKAEYTIPIETFKNPIKSRFREAFQLIKKKEHGSLKEAISLGFELMFESDLNPAIIAACKNLDELDIYLDCLDDNELDKFSCFKISYLVPPDKKTMKK